MRGRRRGDWCRRYPPWWRHTRCSLPQEVARVPYGEALETPHLPGPQ